MVQWQPVAPNNPLKNNGLVKSSQKHRYFRYQKQGVWWFWGGRTLFNKGFWVMGCKTLLRKLKDIDCLLGLLVVLKWHFVGWRNKQKQLTILALPALLKLLGTPAFDPPKHDRFVVGGFCRSRWQDSRITKCNPFIHTKPFLSALSLGKETEVTISSLVLDLRARYWTASTSIPRKSISASLAGSLWEYFWLWVKKKAGFCLRLEVSWGDVLFFDF